MTHIVYLLFNVDNYGTVTAHKRANREDLDLSQDQALVIYEGDCAQTASDLHLIASGVGCKQLAGALHSQKWEIICRLKAAVNRLDASNASHLSACIESLRERFIADSRAPESEASSEYNPPYDPSQSY